MPPADPGNRDSALLARLKELLHDHSQADLARLTGRSRNALTRYVRGAKLPLEFGVALVSEIGVNATWLLAGDEPKYLADVPAASSGLGNELLDMMRAIEGVSKLKLGALSGRGHARALREVSDMLDRYGSLRNRLNEMSAPILGDLLDQAEKAADQRQMDRARALEKVASRIEKFCDDRDLTRRLLSVRAFIHHTDQSIDQATALRSHIFHSRLSLDADFASIAEPAYRLAQVLRSNHHSAKARRVARIAMSYAEGDERKLPTYLFLLGEDVMANVELGLFDGLAASVEYLVQHSHGDARLYSDTVKYYYSLHHGVWSPREIAGAEPSSFPAASMLLNVCFLTDDAELIGRALKRAKELMNPQMLLNRYHVERAEDVVNALRGKPIPEKTIEERLRGGPTASLEFAPAVNRAHVLRIAHDKRAPDLMLQAQLKLEQAPAEISPLPVMVGLHIKNVLSGIPADTRNSKHRELRRKVVDLRNSRIEQGWGLLRMIEA